MDVMLEEGIKSEPPRSAGAALNDGTPTIVLSDTKLKLLYARLSSDSQLPEKDRVKPRAADATVPLSSEQRSIWLHALQATELPLYNEPITIHRTGSFDQSIMERAFNEILRRHEAWRTGFSSSGEQIVHGTMHVRLPVIDLSGLAPEAREQEALRLATEDACKPFSLDQPPLFRARILRMAADEHRLYLTLHHIIFDGVSIYRILMPELAALYDAYEHGKPSPLPEIALQYGDYTLWREQHVQSPGVTRKLDHWRQHLAGDLPVLRLPGGKPRPLVMSYRGSMEHFHLSSELVDDLKKVSKQYRVTLYTVLLASYKALLFRYSGQNDLIVGGAADARRRPELEPVMGYFLDTFAMRTRPNGAMRFSSYLREVHNCVLASLEAAEVPFERVVHAVNPPRDGGHPPIFQAFFSIEPPVAPFAPGWHLTQMDVSAGTGKFDLYLELDERPDRMEARFLYNTDVLDQPIVQRMIGHWLTLLRSIVADPDTPLAELAILTRDELQAEFGPGGWNDTKRDLSEATVDALFQNAVAKYPESTAAIFGEERRTYAQLNARVNELSAQLLAAGVSNGSLIALFLQRSIDLPAAMLAAFRTGSAYLPLDPNTPPERLLALFADARPSAVLTDTHLAPRLTALQALGSDLVVVNVDDVRMADTYSEARTAKAAVASSLMGHGRDTAYVIYTSGTTGEPKAVEIAQTSLVNLLLSMAQRPGFTESDRILAVTTIAFDIAALELLLPLITGGCVAVASREEITDPALLALALERTDATVMQATPSLWRSLLQTGWRGSQQRTGPKLRVFCGGEALTRELAMDLLAVGGEVWNLYGPTETTIWSMVEEIHADASQVTIGTPIANTSAHILNAYSQSTALQIAPVGVQGELYLGGLGLAKGYRGQPYMTAERFLAVPTAHGARLYRTGDLARRRADGSIELQGRTDHQVKIRGHRVELQAVEVALLTHPDVAAAGARTWPEESGNLRLSAYVVGRNGHTPSGADLRSFLARSLPDFYIPSDIVVLEGLPLNGNGKLDRAQLPRPTEHRQVPVGGVSDYGHPDLISLEAQLSAIWSAVLGVATIAPHEDFFDLGGHSLLVASLQAKIAASFGERVPMSALFRASTLKEQAELLRNLLERDNPSPIPGMVGYFREGSQSTIFWFQYSTLARALAFTFGQDQPFYDVSLTEEEMAELSKQPTLEMIARLHVRKLLATNPNGPFVLGGFCTGGILAYEAASQLKAAGHEVALLVMLDAHNPCLFGETAATAVEFSKLRFYLKRSLKGKAPQLTSRLQRRLQRLVNYTGMAAELRTEMWAAAELTQAAALRYKPSSYRGKVLILQYRDRPSRIDRVSEWSSLLKGPHYCDEIPGHHDEVLESNSLSPIAKAIRTHLCPPSSNTQAEPFLADL